MSSGIVKKSVTSFVLVIGQYFSRTLTGFENLYFKKNCIKFHTYLREVKFLPGFYLGALLLFVFSGVSAQGPLTDVTINNSVIIQAGTIAEVDNLTIGSSGKLYVYGTLIVHGNLNMANNSPELVTGSGASVFIYGDAILANKVVIDLSSYFVVLGDFTRTGADKQGSVEVDEAHIYIMGEVNSSWNDFTACDGEPYDGTTNTTSDDCDAGSFDDFIKNVDPEDLPEDVFDSILTSLTVDTTTLVASELLVCSGNTVTLSIDDSRTPLTQITWFRDGKKIISSSGLTSVDTISFQGTYKAVYTYDEVWYSTNSVDIQVTSSPVLAATSANPATCGGKGIIVFTFANVPDGTYQINYGGGNFSDVTVSSGSAAVEAPAGIYNNLAITVNGCSSAEDVDITITDGAAPDISDLSAVYNGTEDVCTGFPAAVKVSSATLSDGTYTIHYDLSPPNAANNKTAVLMFSSGQGTFSTAILSNSGETAVTIKTIEEGGCDALTNLDVNIPVDTTSPTISCPADIFVNPDEGLCTASGVNLGTPVTTDNCGVASLTNNAPVSYSMGTNIVTWTVTDNGGNTGACEQNVLVEPAEIIDVKVLDLGNGCQSGETGSTTTLIWDIEKITGTGNWTYCYTILEGTNEMQRGTDIAVSGSSTQVVYEMENSTAELKTFMLEITGVKDNCGINETNLENNSDTVTFYGVPNTEITSN